MYDTNGTGIILSVDDRNFLYLNYLIINFYRYGKKLPYVVTRDVCPSVICKKYLWNAVLTDLLSWFILKSALIWEIRWFMFERSDFFYFELQVANLCNWRIFAIKFVWTVLTDLLSRFCWKLIYMYVIQWCMSGVIVLYCIVLWGPILKAN